MIVCVYKHGTRTGFHQAPRQSQTYFRLLTNSSVSNKLRCTYFNRKCHLTKKELSAIVWVGARNQWIVSSAIIPPPPHPTPPTRDYTSSAFSVSSFTNASCMRSNFRASLSLATRSASNSSVALMCSCRISATVLDRVSASVAWRRSCDDSSRTCLSDSNWDK